MFLLTILGLEACRTASREKPYVLFCMPALWQSRLWSHKAKQNALCRPQSSELSSWCRILLWYRALLWPSGSALRISRVILSAYNFNHVSPCCRPGVHIPPILNVGVPTHRDHPWRWDLWLGFRVRWDFEGRAHDTWGCSGKATTYKSEGQPSKSASILRLRS